MGVSHSQGHGHGLIDSGADGADVLTDRICCVVPLTCPSVNPALVATVLVDLRALSDAQNSPDMAFVNPEGEK